MKPSGSISCGVFLWTLSLVVVAGCGRYNSEFDGPRGNVSKALKPICDFKPEQTCWMEDMERLRSCSETSKAEGAGTFTSDFKSCDNYNGWKIIFDDTSKRALASHSGGDFVGKLKYTLYDLDPPCYEFEGTSSDFLITSPEHGQLSFLKMPDGGIRIQCFSGELLTVPAKAVESGCANSSVTPEAFVPDLRIQSTLENSEEVWTSTFSGLGEQEPLDVFRCVHKSK